MPRVPLVLDDQESDDPLDWHPKKEEPAGPSDEETLPPELTEPHLAWLERGAPDGEDPAQWYRAGRTSLAEELAKLQFDHAVERDRQAEKMHAKDQRIAELEAKNAELEGKVGALDRVRAACETYFEEHGARHSEFDCPEDDTCRCPEVIAVNDAFRALSAIPDALRPKS